MAKWPYTTQQWQRLRRRKLREHPLCEFCLNVGKIEPAVAVDHIVPISKGGDPYPPLDHLMSCCTSCHNRKTRIVEQQGKELTPKAIRAATCSAIRSIQTIIGISRDLTLGHPTRDRDGRRQQRAA